MKVPHIVNNIFSVSPAGLHTMALEVFHYQYAHNSVYRQWVDALGTDVNQVKSITAIPFLPISFFKTHHVTTGAFQPQAVFTSSGTTHTINSRHYVKDIDLYRQSFIKGFHKFYGDPPHWCIIGLLPSYLERQGSSLVMMVEELVKLSQHKMSGFYLHDHEKLHDVLEAMEAKAQPVLLIGVTFGLLDFAERFSMNLNHTIIMETGGMKGRRREMVRMEVHDILKKNFGVAKVHSEYGMTELLSQAYSAGDGIFKPVPWMKVLVRDEDDPLQVNDSGRGVINIIDLANIDSCSFIATDDAGRLYNDGSFEVLGRTDSSDIRGCSLMAF